jgi:hypothetical protein
MTFLPSAPAPAPRSSCTVEIPVIHIAPHGQAAYVPPATARPTSYEVRLRDAISADSVWVIGHDRRGDVMLQVLMKRRHCTLNAMDSIGQWCRDNDDPVELNVV